MSRKRKQLPQPVKLSDIIAQTKKLERVLQLRSGPSPQSKPKLIPKRVELPCFKLQYRTAEATKDVRNALSKKGEKLNPYFCEKCQAWHIGHAEKVTFL